MKNKDKKIFKIAISGHRPHYWGFDNKKSQLIEKEINGFFEVLKDIIDQNDIRLIMISGMALGIDQIWARIAQLRNIELHSYIPCIDFGDNWFEKNKKYYKQLLDYAKIKKLIYNGYYKNYNGCFQKRNEAMVDDADFSLIIMKKDIKKSGTLNYLNYCKKHNKKYFLVDIDKILETSVDNDYYFLDRKIEFNKMIREIINGQT